MASIACVGEKTFLVTADVILAIDDITQIEKSLDNGETSVTIWMVFGTEEHIFTGNEADAIWELFTDGSSRWRE